MHVSRIIYEVLIDVKLSLSQTVAFPEGNYLGQERLQTEYASSKT